MLQYPILQSGFITSSEKGLIRPVFVKDPFIDFAIDKDHRKSKSLNFHVSQVTNLYEAWRKTPAKLKDFDFREEVLCAAYKAFDCQSIFKWMEMQSLSTKISDIHYTFLLETLAFVYGESRNIQVVQWIRLIEASIEARSVKINVDKYFDRVRFPNTALFSSLLTDFIAAWVTRPGGFEDMLISLYVIFGDRPYVTDVANKNVT